MTIKINQKSRQKMDFLIELESQLSKFYLSNLSKLQIIEVIKVNQKYERNFIKE